MRTEDLPLVSDDEKNRPDTAGFFLRILQAFRTIAVTIDWSVVAIFLVAVVALAMRLYNINWDQNTHLHPDEREINMIAQCLGLTSVQPGCAANAQPANPHFFAYGTFPIYLLALVAHGLAWLFANSKNFPTDGGSFTDFNHITLIGRFLSAVFDTGTVVVTGFTARRLAGRWWGVFAALFMAFTAFAIQLSHFYAVDTVLTFFIALTLYGAIGLASPKCVPQEHQFPPIRYTLGWSVLIGIAAGLAITSKISALPLAVPIFLALMLRWKRLGAYQWPDIGVAAVAILSTTLITTLITMPYMWLDYKSFISDLTTQGQLAKGIIVYPYTIQFANTTPYLYEIKNITIWDMGPGLAVAGFIGALYAAFRVIRNWSNILIIPLSWFVIYFGITGSFYTKFSRYELPIFPVMAVFAAVALAHLAKYLPQWRPRIPRLSGLIQKIGARGFNYIAGGLAAGIIISGVIMSLMMLTIYSEPMTRIAASQWIYAHVPAGSVLTDEIWDDQLPLPLPNYSPLFYRYEAMDLYAPDSQEKAATLASQIAGANYIILSSARLEKSIQNTPYLYPLGSRYYQLLFAGKLGFTLVKTFSNHLHWGPFSLQDAAADESFSVYDHPTVWIFQRNVKPLTVTQLQNILLQGVTLPPQVTSLASQKTLLLTQQSIQADSTTPPLWQRFNPAGLATKLALPIWLIAIEVLGLCAFPILFIALPGLRDRGWGLAKTFGILGLSYFVWLPTSLKFWYYERLTVWVSLLLLAALGSFVFLKKRREILDFLRRERNYILITEIVTLAAFLAFVAIRAADPDLWHIFRGGEKPMELAFLNGILRSRTLPPLDPWFSGGYINYYYFGQFLFATLIQLTGIVPTTAFNLAIPTLFALTISGAISVASGISGKWWVGMLAGWFMAVAGNLDGLQQFIGQVTAYFAHNAIPPFDYWASSRVIPYTINEFPFWSFLYADLHAHVIDLPVTLLAIGVSVSLIMSASHTKQRFPFAALTVGAFALGSMAVINAWDAPTYGIFIGAAILLYEWRYAQGKAIQNGGFISAWLRAFDWPAIRRIIFSLLYAAGGAILFYLPFFLHFQSLYSSFGTVQTPDNALLFLTIFGVWLFLIVSLFFAEIFDLWEEHLAARIDGLEQSADGSAQRLIILAAVFLAVGILLVFGGLRIMLFCIAITAAALLFIRRNDNKALAVYLIIFIGALVAFGVELIFLRDFLYPGQWERMNTVFKFFYQVWTLWAIGAALAVWRLSGKILPFFKGLATVAFTTRFADSATANNSAAGIAQGASIAAEWPVTRQVGWSVLEKNHPVHLAMRGTWLGVAIFLLLGSSVFLYEGTQARLADRVEWTQVMPPTNPAPAVPSLDGFAYMYSWYPGDAAAITWINENISGAPVMLEATGNPYQWYSRVAIYTGLPTVVGWAAEESQQRYPEEVYARQPYVTAVYTADDPAVVETVVQQFHVSYIYVGQLECLTYALNDPNAGMIPLQSNVAKCAAAHDILGPLEVFPQMVKTGQLTVAYQNNLVTIYKVNN